MDENYVGFSSFEAWKRWRHHRVTNRVNHEEGMIQRRGERLTNTRRTWYRRRSKFGGGGESTLDPDPVDVEQLAWRLVSSAEGDAEAPPLPDPPLQESGVFGLPLTESTPFFNATPPPNLEDRDLRWRIPHRRFVSGFSAATVPACFSRKRSSTTIWSSVIAAATHSSLTVVILADADVTTFFIEASPIKVNQICSEREREWRGKLQKRERRGKLKYRNREEKERCMVLLYTRLTILLFVSFFFLYCIFRNINCFLHFSKCKMQIWI